jgi:hypothetical protein
MIDLANEKLLSLSQAARSLPGPPHPNTLWRWHQRGVRGVKLETVLIGGRRFTSFEALERFVHGVTSAADPIPAAKWRTPRQREAAIRRAEEALRRAGV